MSARVVIDATPFLFTHSGVGRVSLRVVEEMLSLLADPSEPASEIELGFVARSLRGQLQHELGAPIKRLRLPRSAESLMRRTGLIERLSPAVLYHATDHAMPLRRPEAAVTTIHDLLFMIRPEAHMAEQHAYQAATVPDFATRCRRVITCSENSKRDIMEHLGIPEDRIDVIYWGIDRKVFTPPAVPSEARERLRAELNIDGPFILGIGCSLGRKNTPCLLEAWRAIKDRVDAKLVLVWNPPEAARQQFGDILGHESVICTGRVSDEILVDLYGCAEVAVYPSLYEGFGLPVLEAMSCGTPMITSNVSSLPEVGGEVAAYIDPSSWESLAEKIPDVLGQDRQQLAARGIAHCNQFTWEQTARKTLAVYQRALKEA